MADEHNSAVYRYEERASMPFVHQLADTQSHSQWTLDEYSSNASSVQLSITVQALEKDWGPR